MLSNKFLIFRNLIVNIFKNIWIRQNFICMLNLYIRFKNETNK